MLRRRPKISFDLSTRAGRNTSTPGTRAPAESALVTPPERADEIFLEGPHSRLDEFVTVLRVVWDFLRGFRVLHFVGPCVTVFGSARVKEESPYYALARQMGAAIARLGFTVMTGGGPGIMEGANRGAKEVGGRRHLPWLGEQALQKNG